MERKTTVGIFRVTNKQNPSREDLDMAKKEKAKERNSFFSNNSTKQRHKNQLCQSKNRYNAIN